MMTNHGAFIPDPGSPRQPAPGVIWPPEQWASFGADAWDLDRRCVVCGGELARYAHSRCWASMSAANLGDFDGISLDGLKRQLAGFPTEIPRNPRNSAESAEIIQGMADWPDDAVRAARFGWAGRADREALVIVSLCDEVLRLRAQLVQAPGADPAWPGGVR